MVGFDRPGLQQLRPHDAYKRVAQARGTRGVLKLGTADYTCSPLAAIASAQTHTAQFIHALFADQTAANMQ